MNRPPRSLPYRLLGLLGAPRYVLESEGDRPVQPAPRLDLSAALARLGAFPRPALAEAADPLPERR